MPTRREFLKLVPLSALALFLWPEQVQAQAAETCPPEPPAPQLWEFPLTFAAEFVEEPRVPTREYYLSVIRG